MSEAKPEPEGLDQWTLYDAERDVINHYDTRGDAEEKQEKARNGLGMDPDLYPPGEMPPGFPVSGFATDEGDGSDETTNDSEPTVTPEVVDHTVDHDPEYEDLPERNVGEDPLEWVPNDFTDTIDGTVAINRKGYEVLSHFYDIDVHSDLDVAPEETGHEYCRVKATAVTDEGRECEAYGSAHIDRGDDAVLLLEMADTRARKRALAIATGVGAVAVEELRNEVQD